MRQDRISVLAEDLYRITNAPLNNPSEKIFIIKGDITEMAVDAIVNAANNTLLGGGGVDGQIHFCAGPQLLEECRNLGGCEKGQAKITRGYNLPAKYVIHTVGPIYGEESGSEDEILASCYTNSLDLARQNGLRTIAFPTIGTGAFRFPKDRAAVIVKKAVDEYLVNYPDAFDTIKFVLFEELDYRIYQSIYSGNSKPLNIDSLQTFTID